MPGFRAARPPGRESDRLGENPPADRTHKSEISEVFLGKHSERGACEAGFVFTEARALPINDFSVTSVWLTRVVVVLRADRGWTQIFANKSFGIRVD